MANDTDTDEELRTFSHQLQSWGAELTPREQALLGHLVSMAAAQTRSHAHVGAAAAQAGAGTAQAEDSPEPEVAGFGFAMPSSALQVGNLSQIALAPLAPRPNPAIKEW